MGILTELIQNFLIFLTAATGSLGLGILVLTFLIRSALLPITLPSLRSSQKMRELQPELNKLKKKHGKDKSAMQKAQMDLYKRYNVNPLAGCIPQIAQLGVLIVLYRALISFLNSAEMVGLNINTSFLWFDLTSPDALFILPILAAGSQLILSLMIAPGAEVRDVVPNKSKKKSIQKANKKEENTADMAQSMQQQMMFLMPLMTGFIALRFPSGLALYWVATTIFSIGQQYYVSGPGGIVSYYKKASAFVTNKIR